MKVSINWLKQLVDLKVPMDEVIRLLPLRTIGTKEITDKFIELDMKGYNRADLLSMRGVALEIAAITDSKVKFKEEEKFIWEGQNLPEAKTEVEDETVIPTYCIAKIEGLNVKPSPKEWVEKLESCGIRSIDCVTDITNLMMLEYGQPMHAFDASQVADETLVARHSKPDEILVTLDGKKRQLQRDDLVIADPEKALDLAGVMGGKNCEITDSTTTIFLEAAIFDPVTIRKTATRLALPSEASRRMQHGLTRTRLKQALNHAINMYESLGGKLTAISLKGTLEDKIKTVNLSQSNLNSLIGIDISPSEVESSLSKLGFELASQGSTLQGWDVKVPYFRLDINIEADIIEEVARMHGYETIPAKPLAGKLPEKIDQSFFELINKLKIDLVKIGLTEVQTYSFYSTSTIKNLKLEIKNLIRVSNPMSSETEYLRTHLWPNLIEVIAKNIKQGYKDIAIFEIGKTYQATDNNSVREGYRLCIALLNGSDNPSQELYQILKTLGKAKLDNVIKESNSKFHPTRHYFLTNNNKPVGKIGEVHPRITNRFGIEKRVAILEIDL